MSDILNQSVNDVLSVRNTVQNVRSSGSKGDIENIPIIIRRLEGNLITLREEEDRLITKLNRNLSSIERKAFASDNLQNIEPIQEYRSYVVNPDPDFLSVYALNKLRRSHPIVARLFKRKLKNAHQIKETNSALNRYRRRLKRTEELLGKKNSPNKEDIQRDKIWNRAVSEILMLKSLHEAYKKRSRNLEGDEAYTEDTKIVNDLIKLQNKFVAFAERNPWVTSGRVVLDLANPGSDTNGTELQALIESIRQIGYADKLDDTVERYSRELVKNVNDPYVSKNLQRTEDLQLVPKPGDKLREATSNVARVIDLVQSSEFYTKLSLRSQADAAERWFRGKISKLYKKKPFCVAPPKSEEEEAKEQQEADQQQVNTAATSDYKKRADRAPEAVGVISEEMLISLRGQDDILDKFLEIPYRLSGSVRDDGVEYGIGIEFSGSRSTSDARARERALAALPASNGKEPQVINTVSVNYQLNSDSPILSGVAAISKRE